MTVGDSFSEQNNIGYQNYLQDSSGTEILHFDGELHCNPFQSVFSLANGDFFEHFKVKYVVLESVERDFILHFEILDTTNEWKFVDLQRSIDAINKKQAKSRQEFQSQSIVKFPYYAVQYFIQDDYYFPMVHRAALNVPVFTNTGNELLFYYADITRLDLNNDKSRVIRANNLLNRLAEKLKAKDIQLIVMPCPDKFDLYYQSILHKDNFPKPLFYDYMADLPKEYIYVDAKAILGRHLNSQKDIYYYDDTHWSPRAAKIIASELKRIISAQ